jgi:integrase
VTDILSVEGLDRWQSVILAWASTKQKRSNSTVTHAAYVDTLMRFRLALHSHGMELDSPPAEVQFFAQEWAAKARRAGKEKLAASSYNRTLAILSSFYRYAMQMREATENPIAHAERAQVTEYEGAVPIDPAVLKRRLLAIERTTSLGIRDFALLLIAVMTGRRATELRNLSIGDITPMGDTVMLTWRRTKGGGVMHDTVEPFVAAALEAHLQMEYGPQWHSMPSDTPVWTSQSTHAHGERLSVWGIAAIYERRLGIKKVHASRHTFAFIMDQIGASATEIQRRLGHKSLQTTDRYLKQLAKPENKHGKAMGKMLGFGEEGE